MASRDWFLNNEYSSNEYPIYINNFWLEVYCVIFFYLEKRTHLSILLIMYQVNSTFHLFKKKKKQKKFLVCTYFLEHKGINNVGLSKLENGFVWTLNP